MVHGQVTGPVEQEGGNGEAAAAMLAADVGTELAQEEGPVEMYRFTKSVRRMRALPRPGVESATWYQSRNALSTPPSEGGSGQGVGMFRAR